jgi:hypothetical protein
MPNFITEEELDKLTPAESESHPAGAPPEPNSNPFYRGTIPSVLQHDTDFVRTQYKRSSGIPTRPLMPANSGSGAQANAGSQGIAGNAIKPVQVQTDKNSAAIQALQGQTFQGAWQSAVSYSLGAIVESGGVVYISLVNNNLGNNPASSPTDWTATGADTFLGAWNSGTSYVIGDIVSVGTALYIATANSTNQNPTSTTGFWQLLTGTSVYEGLWSNLVTYSPGQTVSFTDGNFYICIVGNTNVPPAATGSTDWVLLGSSSVLTGNWSSSTAYQPGMQVNFNGDVYTARVANTNVTPPASATWQLVGSFTSVQTGKNAVYNGGFELNTGGYPVNTPETVAGTYLADGWSISDCSAFQNCNLVNSNNHGGNLNLNLVVFAPSTSIPSTGVFNEQRVLSAPIPVNATEVLNVSGWISVGIPGGLVIPAGGSFIVRLGFFVYDQNGNQLAEAGPFADITTTTAGYINLQGQMTIAATYGGTPPSYMRMQCAGFIKNASGSPWVTTGSQNINASFDDLSVVPVTNLGVDTNDGTSVFGQTASGLSYRPLSNPLTGHDAGANATINVASFTMRTSSKGDISINSGSITGLSYGTGYFIYYDDSTLAGGSVSFAATTTKGTALQGAGRFYVGSITTPLAGAIDTIGNNDGGTGAQSGATLLIISTAQSPNGTSGYGLLTPTSATNTTSNAGATEEQWLGYVPQSSGVPSVITISVTSQVTITGAGTGNAILRYSTDGGSTFTTIYNTSVNRALTTDVTNVTLPANVQKIVVSAQNSHTGGAGSSTHTLSNIQVVVQI